jgi:pimeloyl-ACP methyl ester carboxylesterase
MDIREFTFNGYDATVIIPDKPNGKWIWKTEFFYAFDQAERALLDQGYTRVSYKISNMYGNYDSIRLMHEFHKFVVKEFSLNEKAILFGFSRGGLYAFNYALFYPELVEKIYLDAPVLDMKTWPWEGSIEQKEMFKAYCLNIDTLPFFEGNPIDRLTEFFSHKIPFLIVAGNSDEVVPFERNAGALINFCKRNKVNIQVVIKEGCKHHPHSLDDVTPIVNFVND